MPDPTVINGHLVLSGLRALTSSLLLPPPSPSQERVAPPSLVLRPKPRELKDPDPFLVSSRPWYQFYLECSSQHLPDSPLYVAQTPFPAFPPPHFSSLVCAVARQPMTVFFLPVLSTSGDRSIYHSPTTSWDRASSSVPRLATDH